MTDFTAFLNSREEIMAIKQSVIDGLERYVNDHCPTGDFLRAVLSNDLRESVARADEENLESLPDIVRYCYWELPCGCWGSPDRVQAWLAERKQS